ncbi:MAG: DPP IV N-terminal domain-containing protein, partial [Bacteroidales bacterium]
MRHLLFVVLVYLISPVFLNAQSRDEIEKVPDSLIQTMITPVKWKDSRTLMLSNGDMRNPEYYLEDIRTGKRTVCTSTDMPSVPRETDYGLDLEAKNPTLSPDGSHVAFTLRNDLYSKELETGNIVRYTYDGSETVLNGWASWVYYEEILGRPGRYRSFWWSPDGRYLAFFRCDDTRVPMFPIYVAEGQHGYLERTRYPKAGDENPRVRTGIVPVEGGRIVWADF